MTGFFSALLINPFLQYALIAGVLASIACGIIGTYVVTKKITFLSGGIAHTVLGGVGIACYLNKIYGTNIPPLYGAMVVALIAAIAIGLINLYSEYESDTVIGALWSLGMAVGVIFISMTPGYNTDLMSYLFGNILMVSKSDLYLMITLDVVIIFLGLLFYNKFTAICFDEEFARVKGIRVTFYYLLLLCLTALTIVALIQVVGLILVIALLIMPAAIAKQYVNNMWKMMLVAVILGILFTFSGLLISYEPNLPSGAMIILVTSFFFIVSILHKKYFK
ncbi:MAG: metal ABC transporter permease [Proteobacteria bacterium]|nr:metal ABC transporter permease [Pseudomonadota bacterium]